MTNWSEVADSVYRERVRQMDRGRELPPAAPEDPSSWPYGDETGPPYSDPQEPVLGGNRGDDIKLADFTIGPREIHCQLCWQVHRKGIDCEGIAR